MLKSFCKFRPSQIRLGFIYNSKPEFQYIIPSVYIHSSNFLSRVRNLPKGMYEFPESQADYKISTAEWKYVERLLPLKFIPKPNIEPGSVTPSGWVAPSAKKNDYPYFVTRNSSHLLRVHKKLSVINQRVLTTVKGIEGDVFTLGKELEDYLLPISGKRLISVRVHEPHGGLIIKGDHVNAIKDFLYKKGF